MHIVIVDSQVKLKDILYWLWLCAWFHALIGNR